MQLKTYKEIDEFQRSNERHWTKNISLRVKMRETAKDLVNFSKFS